MPWRKWIVRGVVYGIVALCGAGGFAYQRMTNSAAVREQVIANLQRMFPGAIVSVDSASLHILGYIQINGLRLSRRDDPERAEFLQVSSAVIYHDKEKLLDGELALRKIELHRPRLRVRRDREGKWNLRELTGKPEPSRPLPTIVVHQGTIQLEDRLDDASAPLIEVTEVAITLINDPLPTINVRGAAASEMLGKLQVEGTVRRESMETALTFQAENAPITTALVRRLASGRQPATLLEGLDINALADAHGEVSFRAGAEPSLYYDFHCTIRKGRVRHPKLPLPLDELKATLHCTACRIRLEDLRARSGKAEIRAQGAAVLPALDQDFEGMLEIKHLELCNELCERLPEKLRKLNSAFAPRGPTTLAIRCARRGGQWAALTDGKSPRVSLRPESASICFIRFAYPIDQLTGTLDYDLLDAKVNVDITGKASAQPVFIKGTWQGDGTEAEARFDIQANDVPIDETLLSALPEATQKLARSFHATGKADIKAHIRRDRGAALTEYGNEYHIRVHDAACKWDALPLALEQARVVLDVYPKHWEFRELHALHRGGTIEGSGRATSPRADDAAQKPGVAVVIRGQQFPLDQDLRAALASMPGVCKAWDTFRPQGRTDFVAEINRPTSDSYDLDVRVDAQGGAVEPRFFAYLLHDVSGRFQYRKHRLELTNIKAMHGATQFQLGEGSVDLNPGGGYYADLLDLEARGLRLDDDFVKALPGEKLQTAVSSLHMREPCKAKTRLIVTQAPEPGSLPDIYWKDCLVWLNKATLTTGIEMSEVTGTLGCVGRHDGRQLLGLHGNILLDQATVFKQPFKDVQANFQIRPAAPDVLLVGLRAPLFGGDVAGQVRVEFTSTRHFEVNLTASQIDLKQLGAHNFPKSGVEGLAVGRLHLTGQGAGVDTLDGNGSIDMPLGKLLNLPLLLDLLKFLGLHWPDRTAFEEMHALFGIHGRRVQLRRLDLMGNAISLSGKGEFDLDGSDLQVDFYPTWRVEQLLPPSVRPVPSTISKNLLTIEMRGKVGSNPDKELKFNKRWVPVVFDPLHNLQQRVVGDMRLDKKE